MRWEVADDERFPRVVARGEETAEAAWAHSVHAEPAGLAPAAGTGTASARSASRARSAARAPRRPPTRAATLRFAIASCQRYDVGHYAAWRHVAERRPRPRAVPRRLHLRVRARGPSRVRRSRAASVVDARRSTAPATRPTRATRRCRRRTRARRGCWSGTTTRSRNDYAGLQGQDLEPDFARAARRRLPGLLGAHAVSEVGAAARRRHAHHRPPRLGPAGAHPPARRPPVPRSAGLPEAGPRRLEHGRARATARRSPTRSARCSAPSRSAGSPTAGTSTRPWNLLGAADADGALRVERPGHRRRRLLDRRLGRLRAGAQPPARHGRRATKVPGVVVLGGDVHSNYVADLKADFDDPRVAGRRERVLRHLDHEPVARAVAHRRGARASTRTSATAAATSAATCSFELDAKQLTRELQRRRPAARSGERRHDRGALRRRRGAAGPARPASALARSQQDGPASRRAPSTALDARRSDAFGVAARARTAPSLAADARAPARHGR